MHDRPARVLVNSVSNRLTTLTRLLQDRRLSHYIPLVEEVRSALESQDNLIQKQYDIIQSLSTPVDARFTEDRKPTPNQKSFDIPNGPSIRLDSDESNKQKTPVATNQEGEAAIPLIPLGGATDPSKDKTK